MLMLVVDGAPSSVCLSFRSPLAEKDADSHARDESLSPLVLRTTSCAFFCLFPTSPPDASTCVPLSLASFFYLPSQSFSIRLRRPYRSIPSSLPASRLEQKTVTVWNTRPITAAVYSPSCKSAHLPCT